MRKHAAASDAVTAKGANATALLAEAARQWQAGNEIGTRHGWRNAQASVLAPTGTIGLMMDCDTTGIEPDLALVKFKKLVGGGSMQIVNQTVPRALRSLGYPEEQVEAIVEHIAEHGHVVDAPGLKPDHYPVFDCAMGERSIAPMGHVRMMAAVQPFISGAISKTVNMPESATVEDVERIYFEGWKLGLKALAIYRDNCKVGQPLSAAKREKASEPAVVEKKVVEYRPIRKRLPEKRPSETVSFSVGGAEGGSGADGRVDLAAMGASAPIEPKAKDEPKGKDEPKAKAKETPAGEKAAEKRVGSSTELLELVQGKAADAPLCFTCGTKMRPAGSCYVCEGCGSTSGCS